ncbi:type II toxin-antitoxin system VapC family toxin [Arsenicicoccus bolidensis]|uniref:type II toxin-antitoxin system VapC family toxin n=1 Tax=Arsenicicoccus bolidensis TaxID=229480 RepID=UPI0004104380|nr:PIN domain-containing protein [Arsenicicoccus bolidensis]
MAKSDKPRVLLDSSALIGVIKNEPGAERLDGLLEMVGRGGVELVGSVLILGEVFKQSDAADESERRRQDGKLGNIRRLLESREVMLLDVTKPIVKVATEYRRNRKPKDLPDAIHLATAVLNRCDWLVTFDADFPDVDGLQIFRRLQLEDPKVSLPWAIPVQEMLFSTPSNVVPLKPPGS